MKQKGITALKGVISENKDLFSMMYDIIMICSFICSGMQSVGKDQTLAVAYAIFGITMYTFKK